MRFATSPPASYTVTYPPNQPVAAPLQIAPYSAAPSLADIPTPYTTNVTQKDTGYQENGHTLQLIDGGSDTFTIALKQLLISWVNLTVAGQIIVRSLNPDDTVVFQTIPGGQIVIPCYDELLLLGAYGLRVLSNGIGGEYCVTVHFNVESD